MYYSHISVKRQTLIHSRNAIQNSRVIRKELPDDHHGKTMSMQYKLQHSHLGCRWCKRKSPAFSCNLCYRYTPCHHRPPKLNQLPTIWINKKGTRKFKCQHFQVIQYFEWNRSKHNNKVIIIKWNSLCLITIAANKSWSSTSSLFSIKQSANEEGNNFNLNVNHTPKL